MSWFRSFSFSVIIFLVNISCGKPLPTLDQMDLDAWKNDKQACDGKRATMSSSLEAQSEKLLALDESEIIELLGKPDEAELYTRNQKFYYYFVDPSKGCAQADNTGTRRLIIRFNATGLAKEVSIE
jgi:hypothetical protein